MLASRKTRRGVIGAVVLAGVLAVSGYAMTDQLTTPTASHAGDGAHVVENETAAAVHYGLNTTNPNKVDSVDFTLSHALLTSGSVYVQPVSTGATVTGASTAGTWYSCVITGTVNGVTASATHPACDTTGTELDAVDIDQVRVVAAD